MAVTIPISLTSEQQSALVAQAEAQGLTLDALLRETLLDLLTTPAPGMAAQDHWEQEFVAWLDSIPNLPALSDQAISRETIYTREDEWR